MTYQHHAGARTCSFCPEFQGLGNCSAALEELVVHDSHGRRRYPAPAVKLGSFASQGTPDCAQTSSRRVGCVVTPGSTRPPTPAWAGKLRFSAPRCIPIDDGARFCEVGLPRSIDAVTNGISEPKGPWKDEELPGGSARTYSVALGDLNGDGELDVVVGNNGAINLVLLGKESGRFKEETQALPGGSSRTTSVALGDMNGDGTLDVVVGNLFGSNLLLLNLGNGTFEEARELAGGNLGTYSVVLGDVDGDGALDIVFGNSGAGNQLLLNSGSRGFEEAVELPGGSLGTLSVALGDVDGDGALDVVVGNGDAANQLLLNQGGGRFWGPVELPGGSLRTYAVELGDVDGDGALDIVVGNFGASNFLLLGTGDGNFTQAVELPGGSLETLSLAIGDVNGDGALDVVVGTWAASNQLLLNHMGKGFKEALELPSAGSASFSVALGDVNGDGALDVLLGTWSQGNRKLLSNTDSGFTEPVELPGGALDTRAMAIGDVNGDAALDVVVGHKLAANQVLLSTEAEGLAFEELELPGGSLWTGSLALGDMDDDGRLDIVVGNRGASNQLLWNLGEAGFEEALDLSGGSLETMSVALGDVNGDGALDIVLGNSGDVNQLLVNSGGRGFQEVVELPGGSLDTLSVGLGDVNGDGALDVVFGNIGRNQLLLNNGEGRFLGALELPGGSETTQAVALGDVNGDGALDVVVGNSQASNLLLLGKGDGNFTEAVELPGGTPRTYSIALGDVNADGAVDIAFGNEASSNQLLLATVGEGFTEAVELPGGSFGTHSLAMGDVNGDGALDIVSANMLVSNHVLAGGMCSVGAQLHGGSWCFRCPDFMGRAGAACRECLPDHMQQVGAGELCDATSCPLGQRPLSTDACVPCTSVIGSYYNTTLERSALHPSSWPLPRCTPCAPGSFADGSLPAIDGCFPCPAGEFQGAQGSSACAACVPGSFQGSPGQATCELCRAGGYCAAANQCGGGFSPCLPGSFNPRTGSNSSAACLPCPPGTFSPHTQATSDAACRPCRAGTISGTAGASECERCPRGSSSAPGQTTCTPCEEGTYAATAGQSGCVPCPHPLSSAPGSTTCTVCLAGFVRMDSEARADDKDMVERPDRHCKPCPRDAECRQNTTLTTLQIPRRFWRDSLHTAEIHACLVDEATGFSPCLGSDMRHNMALPGRRDGRYCAPGHFGPRCEACSSAAQYFEKSKSKCVDCPPKSALGAVAGIAAGAVACGFAVYWVVRRSAWVQLRWRRAGLLATSLSLQAKVKICLSFYQVVSTLRIVYGVTLHPHFAAWLDILDALNLDVLSLAYPSPCRFSDGARLSAMAQRLLASALWPFALVLAMPAAIAVHALCEGEPRGGVGPRVPLWRTVLYRSLYAALLISFVVLPSVSGSVFLARKCESFGFDDSATASLARRSYLMADMEVQCSDPTGQGGDAGYKDLAPYFWVLFALWPVAVPLLYLFLLHRIAGTVRGGRTSEFAEAARFLWRDYKGKLLFWEVVETVRKLCLTSLVLFVQTDDGSNKVLRLVLAAMLSSTFMAVIALARPFRRSDDLCLALVSHLLLACIFVSGIVLKLCEDPGTPGAISCEAVVGFSTSYQLTVFLIALCSAMLVGTLLAIVAKVALAVGSPTIKVASTGRTPVLELPSDCHHHCFFSHTWGTGQDQTHAIIRRLQLLLPELRSWLDVDCLEDVSKLESAVAHCAVLVVFLSEGYFRSPNCRRELYTALATGKPIVAVREADKSKGGASVEELVADCQTHCVEVSPKVHPEYRGPAEVEERVFGGAAPVVWVRVHEFQLESLKLIALGVLRHLPYYKRAPAELDKGLRVAGELGPFGFTVPATLLVCAANHGAWGVAEELAAASEQGEKSLRVALKDAEQEVFHGSWAPKTRVVLLLYLNAETFADAGGENLLGAVVKRAMERSIALVLLHEQAADRGGCPFSHFFEVAPKELQLPPHNLFNQVAFPLYPEVDHRSVSMRVALRAMGALPLHPRAASRALQPAQRPPAGPAASVGLGFPHSTAPQAAAGAPCLAAAPAALAQDEGCGIHRRLPLGAATGDPHSEGGRIATAGLGSVLDPNADASERGVPTHPQAIHSCDPAASGRELQGEEQKSVGVVIRAKAVLAASPAGPSLRKTQGQLSEESPPCADTSTSGAAQRAEGIIQTQAPQAMTTDLSLGLVRPQPDAVRSAVGQDDSDVGHDDAQAHRGSVCMLVQDVDQPGGT